MKAHLSVNEIGLGNPAAFFGDRPSLLPSVAPIGVQLFERSHRGAVVLAISFVSLPGFGCEPAWGLDADRRG